MTDVLIRNVSEDDLARIDEWASNLGLSRSEYLRRRIVQDARRDSSPVSVADLQRFAVMGADLLDEGVMRDAWS